MWTSNAKELADLLSGWRGARGQAWAYSCSHARLLIRLYRDEPSPIASAYLYCAACRRIHFDTHWRDSDIQIVSKPDGGYRISDGDRLLVECEIVRAAESEDF